MSENAVCTPFLLVNFRPNIVGFVAYQMSHCKMHIKTHNRTIETLSWKDLWNPFWTQS